MSFRNKLELASQSFSSVGIFCQCIMVTPRTMELATCGGLTFICVTSGFGLPWALGKYSLAAKPRDAPAYSSAL